MAASVSCCYVTRDPTTQWLKMIFIHSFFFWDLVGWGVLGHGAGLSELGSSLHI